MKRSLTIVGILATAALLVGCKSSHEEGVKSNYRTQWTPVAADTVVTTNAAKSVFEAEGLKDVSGSSTKVDGKAKGKMADGTDVTATIQKETETTSTVSVTVGTLGDPTLGAEMAKKIKLKAETK
jgi:hypothetical protein